MRIAIDVKALEWQTGTFLCQDKIALEELWNNEDMHTKNQQAFKLPSRLIAKKFLFRLIYGGSAYAYAHDPEFKDASTSVKFWQSAIDAFYNKYQGWAAWHTKIVQTVIRTKQLVMPTGRIYTYQQYKNERTGEMDWPKTQILNFPVNFSGLI